MGDYTRCGARRGARCTTSSADKKIMAVEVSTDGPTFTTGPARLGVDTRIAGRERINQGTPFAVTPDGQRIRQC